MASFTQYLPCLNVMRSYRAEWLPRDIAAGVSVAAIAIPVSIAYAQLAGFPPVMGLYASILPLVAYAIFGSSRQLMVNPDSATCAMIAAVLHPLAVQNAGQYQDLAIVLTIVAGVLCLIGGFAKLGFVASFLAYPVLVGYLNGIALSIIGSQLGKLMGVQIKGGEFFEQVAEAVYLVPKAQWLTLLLGLAIMALMFILKFRLRRVPAPLVGVVVAGVLAWVYGLEHHGVAVLGKVPAGLPQFHVPVVTQTQFAHLVSGAFGLVIVSFCSGMLTARGFAAKNGYNIDPNQDLIAFGFANISAGVSNGFMVTGADSRTAINDMMGGKTQLAGVVAAGAMAAVLFFLTAPLAYVPETALAAVLVVGAVGLFDFATVRRLRTINPIEFQLSVLTTVAVITIGVFPAIVVAVSFSLLKLLQVIGRPHEVVLSRAPSGAPTLMAVDALPATIAAPGIVVYQFDAPVVFFNCEYFQTRVRAVVSGLSPRLKYFVFDAEGSVALDTTAANAIEQLRSELAAEGVTFAIARCPARFRWILDRTGLAERIGVENLFPSIHAAVEAYEAKSAGTPDETATPV